jgi:hypothetical protein
MTTNTDAALNYLWNKNDNALSPLFGGHQAVTDLEETAYAALLEEGVDDRATAARFARDNWGGYWNDLTGATPSPDRALECVMLAMRNTDRDARDWCGDWTDLPSWGERPSPDEHVWSWDDAGVLVGTCSDDLRIVSREEWSNAE